MAHAALNTEGLTIERLNGVIGAVVSGVDLRAPLDDGMVAGIERALVDHQVLFFRDQDLDDDQQRAFARRFGTLSVYPVARLAGDLREVSYIEDTAESPPKADQWHTDITWMPEPPKYAFLNARIVPEYGGDTMWASLYAAYDALSPAMQAFCSQLTAVHTFNPHFLTSIRASKTFGPAIADKLAEAYPPAEHPLVRTHPITGRPALFLSEFMDHIVGLRRAESDLLMAYFQTLLTNPNLQVRWKWRPHDLAVWDEASTNHRALSDHYPQHRKVRRCTVDGDRPFFRPAA